MHTDNDQTGEDNTDQVLKPDEPNKSQGQDDATVDDVVDDPKPGDDTTQQDATEDSVEDTGTSVEGEWAMSEDAIVTGIQSVMKEGGFSATEADAVFAKALETGDLADIDTEALVAKLGKEKADLVLYRAKDYYDQNMKRTKDTVASVHEFFGGEDNFDVVAAWAQSRETTDKGFEARMNGLRGMFDAGGVQAELAAKELQNMYNADDGTSTPNPKVEQGTAGVKQSQLEFISRKDYAKEVGVAYKDGNKDEVANLQARRRATLAKAKA